MSHRQAATRAAELDPAAKATMLRVARMAVGDVDAQELVAFAADSGAFLAGPRRQRREPGDFGSTELQDSLTAAALAASLALVELGVVALAEQSWRRLAAWLAARRRPAIAEPPHEPLLVEPLPVDPEPVERQPVESVDTETVVLLRELDRFHRAAYEGAALFLTDDAERTGLADAVLAAYIRDRLAAVEQVRG